MKRCEISGKGMTFGHQVSHSPQNVLTEFGSQIFSLLRLLSTEKQLKLRFVLRCLRLLKELMKLKRLNILKSNVKTLSPKIAKILSK